MEQKEINIDKLVAGDERAFIAFIEYHSSALYHYAFNILHQKECAEEVVSDSRSMETSEKIRKNREYKRVAISYFI